MTVELPKVFEDRLQAEVDSGRFASLDAAVSEAIRLLLSQPSPAPGTGADNFIGAFRDIADELGEIAEDATRRRREEIGQTVPDE